MRQSQRHTTCHCEGEPKGGIRLGGETIVGDAYLTPGSDERHCSKIALDYAFVVTPPQGCVLDDHSAFVSGLITIV
jgi:hypothetical protein